MGSVVQYTLVYLKSVYPSLHLSALPTPANPTPPHPPQPNMPGTEWSVWGLVQIELCGIWASCLASSELPLQLLYQVGSLLHPHMSFIRWCSKIHLYVPLPSLGSFPKKDSADVLVTPGPAYDNQSQLHTWLNHSHTHSPVHHCPQPAHMAQSMGSSRTCHLLAFIIYVLLWLKLGAKSYCA